MKSEFFKKYQAIFIHLFLLSLWILFGYFFVLSLQKPLYQDEGVFLTIGKGIANGRLPYLDFWDHKPPGIYLVWSTLFPLFSTKIIYYKIFVWLVNFLTAILVFGISEKLKKGSGKFSIILFLCALIFFEGNYLSAGPFLGFLTALSLWLVIFYPEKSLAFLGSGFFLGLSLLFKQTAILSLGAFLIYLLWQKKYRKTVYLISGFLLPVILIGLYLWNRGILSEFWHQAVVSSLQNYPAEPLKAVLFSWFETFARVWWLWLGAILSFWYFRKLDSAKWLLFLSTTLPILSFIMRPYPHYWLQILPVIAVFSGLGFLFVANFFIERNQGYFFIAGSLLIVFSLYQNLLWFNWVTVNLNRPKEIEQQKIAQKLKEFSDAKILTENRYTGFYFLTDLQPLNRFLYLTEVNESESARQKTLDDLKNKKNIIALWPKDQKYVYAKEIGQYLAENYRVVGDYPELDLLIFSEVNGQ